MMKSSVFDEILFGQMWVFQVCQKMFLANIIKTLVSMHIQKGVLMIVKFQVKGTECSCWKSVVSDKPICTG